MLESGGEGTCSKQVITLSLLTQASATPENRYFLVSPEVYWLCGPPSTMHPHKKSALDSTSEIGLFVQVPSGSGGPRP